jgi:hypothetical protein
MDSAGSAYVAGGTSSTTFPTTFGAYQTSFGGNFDVFVAKFGEADMSKIGGSDSYGITFDTGYVSGQHPLVGDR